MVLYLCFLYILKSGQLFMWLSEWVRQFGDSCRRPLEAITGSYVAAGFGINLQNTEI